VAQEGSVPGAGVSVGDRTGHDELLDDVTGSGAVDVGVGAVVVAAGALDETLLDVPVPAELLPDDVLVEPPLGVEPLVEVLLVVVAAEDEVLDALVGEAADRVATSCAPRGVPGSAGGMFGAGRPAAPVAGSSGTVMPTLLA
jgi:hypothetical protein